MSYSQVFDLTGAGCWLPTDLNLHGGMVIGQESWSKTGHYSSSKCRSWGLPQPTDQSARTVW
jgi:hypothetical protein